MAILRSPDKLLCLQWVKKAWEFVATEVIINSFKVCDIPIETDSTEDGLMHCINLEGWQLMPQQRSQPRQLRSLLANNVLLNTVSACMHRRTMWSVTCTLCGTHVVAKRTCASILDCTYFTAKWYWLTLILFPPLNCTSILAGTEINSTRGKKSRKYGIN